MDSPLASRRDGLVTCKHRWDTDRRVPAVLIDAAGATLHHKMPLDLIVNMLMFSPYFQIDWFIYFLCRLSTRVSVCSKSLSVFVVTKYLWYLLGHPYVSYTEFSAIIGHLCEYFGGCIDVLEKLADIEKGYPLVQWQDAVQGQDHSRVWLLCLKWLFSFVWFCSWWELSFSGLSYWKLCIVNSMLNCILIFDINCRWFLLVILFFSLGYIF